MHRTMHRTTTRRLHRAPLHPAIARMIPIVLLLVALAACADRVTGPTTPAAPVTTAHVARVAGDDSIDDDWGDGLPAGIVRQRLEQAAAGLTYTSESDYPFTWYFHAGPIPSPLTIDGFRATLGIPATAGVETRDLDEFFARHIEWVDPYDATAVALVPRYRALRDTIREVLRDPQVFRVGKIAIDCYIVGYDRAGNLVGLTTVAIET